MGKNFANNIPLMSLTNAAEQRYDIVHDIPIMLSIKDAAKRYGIAQHHVRQLALSGKVKAIRAGGKGKILVNCQSIEDYFNSSYLNAAQPAPMGSIQPISVKL